MNELVSTQFISVIPRLRHNSIGIWLPDHLTQGQSCYCAQKDKNSHGILLGRWMAEQHCKGQCRSSGAKFLLCEDV